MGVVGCGCHEALNIRVVSDPGLGSLLSICRSLRGHGQNAWAGTLQGNISSLLRAVGWMPRASHDLMCRPVWYKWRAGRWHWWEPEMMVYASAWRGQIKTVQDSINLLKGAHDIWMFWQIKGQILSIISVRIHIYWQSKFFRPQILHWKSQCRLFIIQKCCYNQTLVLML